MGEWQNSENHKQLRWGILGCAAIARHSVIPGIQQSETGAVAAIASRGLSKAQETADSLGIPVAYGSYEELLADSNIDAIYVPLPNHLHMEWSVRAMQAGKHVLCEKPMALNEEQARQMVDAARQAGVHLAEAFMYRHQPHYRRMQEIIASGEIGEVRGIHSTFTFNNAADHNNVRYRRDWGGGSLYDIGCYPISAARMLLGREPEAATVHALISPEHDNVDMMAAGVIEFPDSIALTFDCSMWAAFRNTLEVIGTTGRIIVPSAFVGNMDFAVETADGRREEQLPALNSYALQADDFARAAWGMQEPLFAAEDCVAGMKVLDACLESAYSRARVAIR